MELIHTTAQLQFQNFLHYPDIRVEGERAAEFLRRCCLDFPVDTSCDTLSGGERQRVFLAIFLSLAVAGHSGLHHLGQPPVGGGHRLHHRTAQGLGKGGDVDVVAFFLVEVLLVQGHHHCQGAGGEIFFRQGEGLSKGRKLCYHRGDPDRGEHHQRHPPSPHSMRNHP